MNFKHSASVTVATIFLPILAQAEPASGGENSMVSTIFFSLLPLVILGGLFFWLLRWVKSSNKPRIKKADEYMMRSEQHMERVEQSLERIAKLLEKRD